MGKRIYIHLCRDANYLTSNGQAANASIAAVKRFAASLRPLRPEGPELTQAEGLLEDLAELKSEISRAEAALRRAG